MLGGYLQGRRISSPRSPSEPARGRSVNSLYRKALAIEPLCLRIPAASDFVGISRSKIYELIASSEIETIKLGSATLVLTQSRHALIEARRGQ